MKNKWKVIGGVITGMVMTTAVQAIPIALNTVYTSTLASTTPADDITVKWEVSTTAVPGTTLGAGDYDYEYQVVNAETATTVDNFAVSFNAIPGVNVLTTGGGPAGTISAAELGIGVNWFSLSALAAKGGSTAGLNTTGVLYFTSPDLPTLGNADANITILLHHGLLTRMGCKLGFPTFPMAASRHPCSAWACWVSATSAE
jgi:hypothetical protein